MDTDVPGLGPDDSDVADVVPPAAGLWGRRVARPGTKGWSP